MPSCDIQAPTCFLKLLLLAYEKYLQQFIFSLKKKILYKNVLKSNVLIFNCRYCIFYMKLDQQKSLKLKDAWYRFCVAILNLFVIYGLYLNEELDPSVLVHRWGFFPLYSNVIKRVVVRLKSANNKNTEQ